MPSSQLPFNDVTTHRFAQVLYQCLEALGSTKTALYLCLKGADELRLVSHYGFPRLMPPPERLALEDPLVQWVRRERRTFAVNNAAEFPELACLVKGSDAPRLLFTPVYDKGQWLGFLVQRDRSRGAAYDVERDEAPTLAICQEIVIALHELRMLSTPGNAADSRPSSLLAPAPQPLHGEVPAIPVPVPHSDSMFPPTAPQHYAPGPALEGFGPNGAGEAPVPATEPARGDTEADKAQGTDASGLPVLRPGIFLPEQRTFFWEAASLLCSIVPLGAVALWMDEPQELRPILAYSRLPLSPELKQEILVHATYHIGRVEEKDLRLLAKSEWIDENPAPGRVPDLPSRDADGGRGGPGPAPPLPDRGEAVLRTGADLHPAGGPDARLPPPGGTAARAVPPGVPVGGPSHPLHGGGRRAGPALPQPHTAKLARNFALRLELPSHEVEAVSIAAILHDVGTLLLDPKVLSKPELTPEDLARVRTHPVLASTFLKDFRFPFDVLRIIRHHHERWDGTGYPDGLKGEEIPIGSRIISLIEAFEVMSTGNGYKPPKPSREILEELRREASAQFDPSLASQFIEYLTTRARRAE